MAPTPYQLFTKTTNKVIFINDTYMRAVFLCERYMIIFSYFHIGHNFSLYTQILRIILIIYRRVAVTQRLLLLINYYYGDW